MNASLRGPFFNYYLGEIYITIYTLLLVNEGTSPVQIIFRDGTNIISTAVPARSIESMAW